MTQSPPSPPKELSDKDVKQIQEGVQQVIDNCKQEEETVKNDKKGFETLKLACKCVFEQGEIKENEETSSFTGLSALWKSFAAAAQGISDFAAKFLENLKKADLSKELKKKIAIMCRKFKTLLQNTSRKLQAYRLDIDNMIKTFDSIIEVLIPPEEVYADLQSLTKEESLKMVESFATENKDELKKKLQKLSTQMKDNKNLEMIKSDSRKWSKLKEELTSLLIEVDERQKMLRRNMWKMIGISAIVVSVLVIVGTCGAGSAAVGALFCATVKTGTAIIAGTAIVFGGVGLAGLFLSCNPQICDNLKFAKNKAITAISKGLEQIATQSDKMNQMLEFMYKEWVETMHKDPNQSYKDTWGRKVQASELLKSLYSTRSGLEQLKTSIVETEKVCDEQLLIYTDKIFKPLLTLYT